MSWQTRVVGRRTNILWKEIFVARTHKTFSHNAMDSAIRWNHGIVIKPKRRMHGQQLAIVLCASASWANALTLITPDERLRMFTSPNNTNKMHLHFAPYPIYANRMVFRLRLNLLTSLASRSSLVQCQYGCVYSCKFHFNTVSFASWLLFLVCVVLGLVDVVAKQKKIRNWNILRTLWGEKQRIKQNKRTRKE